MISYIENLDAQNTIDSFNFLKSFKSPILFYSNSCLQIFNLIFNQLAIQKIKDGMRCIIKEKYMCECKRFFGSYRDLEYTIPISLSFLTKTITKELILNKNNHSELICPKIHNTLSSILSNQLISLKSCMSLDCNKKIKGKYKVIKEPDLIAFTIT